MPQKFEHKIWQGWVAIESKHETNELRNCHACIWWGTDRRRQRSNGMDWGRRGFGQTIAFLQLTVSCRQGLCILNASPWLQCLRRRLRYVLCKNNPRRWKLWRSIDSWIFSNWMWSIVFEKHRKNQVKTYRLDQGATLSSSLLAMSSENMVGNNQNNFNIWIYHVCFIQWNWQLWWYDRYYILCTTKNQSAAWLASKSAMVCSISCKHRANTKDLLLKCHLTWNHSNIYIICSTYIFTA